MRETYWASRMETRVREPSHGTAARFASWNGNAAVRRDRGRHLGDVECELDRARRIASSPDEREHFAARGRAHHGISSMKATTAPLTIPDSELMARMTAGSVEAFAELYDRYCDRAYRVAQAVCRDDGRAEDAVQEAFLTVWRSSGSYRPERGSVGAWLLTMVRYRAIDLVRRNCSHERRRASEEQLPTLPGPADPSEEVISRDDSVRLRTSLQKLPDAQQEVIILAFFGQLSHVEIATQLGLPPGTVKGRMRLGLQKLSADVERIND
jgi:RNA polymerase sigma-70 factor (ECF subfamily)